MAQKKEMPVVAQAPAEEEVLPLQQEEKETPAPAQEKQPDVVFFFTTDGVRVNSENQPVDKNGKVLDEKPLLRG